MAVGSGWQGGGGGGHTTVGRVGATPGAVIGIASQGGGGGHATSGPPSMAIGVGSQGQGPHRNCGRAVPTPGVPAGAASQRAIERQWIGGSTGTLPGGTAGGGARATLGIAHMASAGHRIAVAQGMAAPSAVVHPVPATAVADVPQA